MYRKPFGSLAGLAYVVCLSFAPSAFGQERYWGQSEGCSWNSSEAVWHYQETRKLDKQFLRLPDDGRLSQLEVEWKEVVVEELGNYCTISGCIQTKSDVGQWEPIDWQQYIGVHLNQEPLATPDWSGGVDPASVMSKEAKVDRDGTFRADFDLRECHPRFREFRQLQVGVSLAQQTFIDPDQLIIELNSSFPVLKRSVRMLTIPVNKELPEILRLINDANGWPDRDSSAVDLIRAANALRKLGRDEAIQAMEDYRRLVMAPDAELDIMEAYVIYGLIQCAFEPADPNENLPSPKYLMFLDSRTRSVPFAAWPRDPMEIYEDIPWLLGKGVMLGGVPWDPQSDLTWLRRHGVLRDTPLRPADNPLASAVRLMQEPRFAMLPEDIRKTATSQLKEQAWAMVADFLPPVEKNSWGETDVEGKWDALFAASEMLGLHWDESAQAYSISGQGVTAKPLR